MGLRFQSDILNLKCRKIQKTLFTPLIVVNLSSSSILQVEQQKVTVFFPYFLIFFMQRLVGYTVGWFPLFKKWSIYFDLLYLSFPGSLGYIVCQHYESLFELPIFGILFNMGARWFCLTLHQQKILRTWLQGQWLL